jgi:hypothetical protein
MIIALLRNSEICFAWCQSLAFLLVARNLYEVKAMTNANWTTFCAEKYTKTVNLFLILGLIISNLVLVIFLIALALSADPTPGDNKENKFFVHLEIASWFLGIFSAFTLIGSTLYTSWVLRNLYGTDFRSTSYEILAVGAIFILSFASRSIFEWVMFYYYNNSISPLKVINMMEGMTVFMPIVWDLLPISTILVLHHENYSRKAKNREE